MRLPKFNFYKLTHKKPKILNLCKILRGYAYQPFFILIHLTLDCNGNCINCYQRNDLFYSNKDKHKISLSDYEKILFSLKKSYFFSPRIHFFGGEPLLHPQFAEILALTDKYNFSSSLTTNGFLLNKYIDVILKSGICQINISLDGVGRAHDQIRGIGGCFDKVVDSIKNLRQIENTNKVPEKDRKIININCLILKENYVSLIELASFFSNKNIDINYLSYEHIYSDANYFSSFDIKTLKEQIHSLAGLSKKCNFKIITIPSVDLKNLEYYYSNKADKENLSCIMPWLGLNIMPDLKVTPGAGVLGCQRLIGDLNCESIAEIWNNREMRIFRNEIIKKIPPECYRCCHRYH